MLSFRLLIVVALGYVAFLFLVAFWADRRARRGLSGWTRSPLIYTLSLSIYCTAWTFYGAVGYAARSGLEYLTIYLGPTLVMVAFWGLLRKLVRIGRSQRITSIADLISSRYGKSNGLGVLVTLLAVIGTTPYIALQLQSVTLSIAVFARGGGATWDDGDLTTAAAWVAAGLAVFTILFGTRAIDASERHSGVVMAIAVEAVVKLAALLAVGVFVVWSVSGGVTQTLALIDASDIATWQISGGRWAALTFVSAAAFLCLPRMFHVLVVENVDERHVTIAAWAFPLYLFAMSLFVVPIAVVGLEFLPPGSNPDLFVLTLPLAGGSNGLALLSFLGGFSSATSMVIVASIALSTMVSNHIVLPIWLSQRGGGAMMSGDMRHVLIGARRVSIVGVLLLGLGYYRLSGGSTALAAIGLIAFAGVAQVLPAMLGGIFWRGATRIGAIAGLVTGFSVWLYTLFLPGFGPDAVMSASMLSEGPFGIGWLRPQAFFGIEALDPVVHAIFWSMMLNTAAFLMGSFLSFPAPMERLQGAQMVEVFDHALPARGWQAQAPQAEDLLVMAQRIIGGTKAQRLFQAEALRQGSVGYLPEITPDFLTGLERELAGSVGAATAHAMIGRITGSAAVTVDDLIAVADETAQIMEASARIEAQSRELGHTARQLRQANEKLTALSEQKDAFLSQISHELRTPMTSIRSFSDLLRDDTLAPAERTQFATIIHDEAVRLTRLLDDLLDLSALESGRSRLDIRSGSLSQVVEKAIRASDQLSRPMAVHRDPALRDITLHTDLDRLGQVLINLVSNARKYCVTAHPELRIRAKSNAREITIDLIDNGPGIPAEYQDVIFEKFTRLSEQSAAGSAGLGLAICREIMTRLGGTIAYLPGQAGAAFRIVLPRQGVVD